MSDFFEIQVEVEKDCPLNCNHCSSFPLKNVANRGYSLSDLKRFTSLFTDSTHIYLTGGEPLISKSLCITIQELIESNPRLNVGIFTSGIIEINGNKSSLSREYAKSLSESGLQNCYISFYHFDPEMNSHITNTKESINYTLQSIEHLLDEGIDVKAHLVLNKYNINSLNNVIVFLADIGVSEVRLLRLVHSGNAINNWSDIGIPYEIQNKTIMNLINQVNNYPTKVTISGFPDLIPCRPFKEAVKCQGGLKLMYVTYEGDVFPCACTRGVNGFKIGHITDIEKINEFKQKHNTEFNLKCLNPLSEQSITLNSPK